MNPHYVAHFLHPLHPVNLLPYNTEGMIHNTQMALSELGTKRDVAVVRELYQEDWWLRALIAGDPDAIWRRHWYPHNYEVTAFEAYLDMYVLTGNTTYIDAVKGAWRLFR